ncbi:MAG: hypothetical protein QME76_06705 [Bacillota bacterium]|nr:hypothetical protein [Bacillota bacterium]
MLEQTEISSPLGEAVRAMVLNRSKRAVHEWLDVPAGLRRPGAAPLLPDAGLLAQHKENIENALLAEARNLFNLELDWSSGRPPPATSKDGSGVAGYGYSKDRRPDRVQIIVGVLMTREGMPVAHQVFPGKAADIQIFKAAINDARASLRYPRRVCGECAQVDERTHH